MAASWVYRKPEPSNVQGMCVKCGKNPQRRRASRGTYRPLCNTCDRKRHDPDWCKKENLKRRGFARSKLKSACEKCGFVPVHTCQLDIDHIDGNRKNGADDNLQTLCANCHRLKTFLNRDWEKKRPPAT